jgi:hypothetical protein
MTIFKFWNFISLGLYCLPNVYLRYLPVNPKRMEIGMTGIQQILYQYDNLESWSEIPEAVICSIATD